MEVSDLRKEISKCLQQAYGYGNISHIEKYKDDIDDLDNMVAQYYGKYYNKDLQDYE